MQVRYRQARGRFIIGAARGYPIVIMALILLLLLSLFFVAYGRVVGQAQDESYTFPETGKTVSGRFLAYWKANGGLPRQGYPISELIQEKSELDGKVYIVQYFERAVFELHPENTAPNQILLSLLGVLRYHQNYTDNPPSDNASTDPAARSFQQTGKKVGGRFLDYWQGNGGLAQFGYPITNEFDEVSPLNGKTYLVQYFQRAVFERHPENQPPYDVLLSHLGRYQYELKYHPTPVPSPTPTPAPRYMYGLIGQGGMGEQIDTALLQAQYNAGVRVRFVQLGWDVLQPSGPSSWDAGITNAFQQRIDALLSYGQDVRLVLDLGIQYSPAWVNAIDPLQDQYGNVYQAGFPNGGVNVYWSPTVRQHVASYIQRVFSTINFRGRLWAVRVGPYRGELMYPEQSPSEENLSFWAFDSQAQAQSPVGDWKPGESSPNGEAERFYNWYVDNLVNTFNFFLGEIRHYYSGYVAPVTPGVGMQGRSVSKLIAENLSDPSLTTYGTGNYWQRIFSQLPGSGQNVINWCSSMGDGSGDDSSANWWEWSSARVQAHLAQLNGRRIYGENSSPNPYDTSSGADPKTTMQSIFNSMQENNYLGLMWVSQSYMADPGSASLSQYSYMISQFK